MKVQIFFELTDEMVVAGPREFAERMIELLAPNLEGSVAIGYNEDYNLFRPPRKKVFIEGDIPDERFLDKRIAEVVPEEPKDDLAELWGDE